MQFWVWIGYRNTKNK